METKICANCKTDKPIECYGKHISHKDGLRSNCKECRKQSSKKHYVNNREHIKKRCKQYKTDNAEYYKQYTKQWRKNNRDICNKYEQSHNAIKKELPSTFTAGQWTECKAYFKNCCAYCGKKVELAQEHYIPVSKGGGYTADNIIPACKSCNSSKHDKPMSEWYSKQSFYAKKREKAIAEYLNKSNIGIQITINLFIEEL